uniref:Uncharacterized protein n=1 Tax=Leersia perrieri TaxID=77586 RepID=A0A0G2KBI2_9ORYZ
MLLANQFS